MNRFVRFLQKYPLFLVLVPLFIVLHIEKEYQGLITYNFVYKQIIELFIAPVVILLFCLIIFRNWRKALACCFVYMIIFYFFADLKDWLVELFPGSFISSYKFLLPFVLLIAIAGLFLVKKIRHQFMQLVLFANLGFFFFIMADLVVIFYKSSPSYKSFYAKDLPASCKDCPKPDIYFVVFDSYTSSSTLLNEFGFNNSRIDSFLSQKGFYQLKNSHSNYNFTPYSIGATLNMEYFDGIDPGRKIHLRDYLPYIGKMRENRVVSYLQNEGYEIVNHSIFDFRGASSTIPHTDHWNHKILYQRHNIFKKIDLEIGWFIRTKISKSNRVYLSDNYIIARDRHDSIAIAHLKETVKESSAKPRFVYTHVEIPHAPFSFDSTGKRFRVPIVVSPERDKADYVSQLIYANTKLTDVINTIFHNTRRPLVIILQGDHGYRFFDRQKSKYELDNLSAFYFYNKDYIRLYDSMSNVNTFRAVFNTFFQTRLAPLKDSSIYLPY